MEKVIIQVAFNDGTIKYVESSARGYMCDAIEAAAAFANEANAVKALKSMRQRNMEPEDATFKIVVAKMVISEPIDVPYPKLKKGFALCCPDKKGDRYIGKLGDYDVLLKVTKDENGEEDLMTSSVLHVADTNPYQLKLFKTMEEVQQFIHDAQKITAYRVEQMGNRALEHQIRKYARIFGYYDGWDKYDVKTWDEVKGRAQAAAKKDVATLAKFKIVEFPLPNMKGAR